MPIKACHVRVLVDGVDLSTQSNSAVLSMDVGAIDFSTFQVCTIQRQPIAANAVLEHAGYFHVPNAGYIEKEMYDRLADNDDSLISLVLGTNLVVPVAYFFTTGWNGNLKIDAPIKNLLTVQGRWNVRNVPMRRGYQIFYGRVTSTGGQTGVDFTAFTSKECIVGIHILDIEGTATDAEIIVQSSAASNFTSPTTLLSHEFDAESFETATVTGTGRYIRAKVVTLGGADAITFAVVCGVQSLTY